MRNDPINPIARVVFMASTVGVNIAGWGLTGAAQPVLPARLPGFPG